VFDVPLSRPRRLVFGSPHIQPTSNLQLMPAAERANHHGKPVNSEHIAINHNHLINL